MMIHENPFAFYVRYQIQKFTFPPTSDFLMSSICRQQYNLRWSFLGTRGSLWRWPTELNLTIRGENLTFFKDIRDILPTLLILVIGLVIMILVIPYAFSSVFKQLAQEREMNRVYNHCIILQYYTLQSTHTMHTFISFKFLKLNESCRNPQIVQILVWYLDVILKRRMCPWNLRVILLYIMYVEVYPNSMGQLGDG